MTHFHFKTTWKRHLADTFTPVSLYLKLRDKFPNTILLESSDYHSNENSYSFICCNPVAHIKMEQDVVSELYPDGTKRSYSLQKTDKVAEILSRFIESFKTEESPFGFISNGLFGYTTYDAVRYFEDIRINTKHSENKAIPDLLYSLYQNVIVINHFKNELYVFDHTLLNLPGFKNLEGLEYIESIINNKNFPTYPFETDGEESTNMTDDEFLRIIAKGKEHCHRGDVFQIVLSREFSQKFRGDDFNVYRALRSINPSPYLFYFDYGSFKLFGSSPEAQLVIKNNHASIFPIAGTFRRTGDDLADAALAEKLKTDSKENAEHIMLVDLARNDLSRNCTNVKVETFREIQYYSHVIHLVSKVTGTLENGTSVMKVVGDTFPAGTLSGAPKYKAMELISKYEPDGRGFYGGCIGFIGFNQTFNHAIIIRSFLSKNNTLYYRAGAGVVAASDDVSELNEVNNKLAALKKAISFKF